MRARPFDYVAVRSLSDAVARLRDDPDAIVLAGGQSLMPALVLGERSAAMLVDVTAVPELHGIETGHAGLRIGAAVTMWDIERDPGVARTAPLLVQTLRTIGAPGIRSRATLGGSLAWADPVSQLPGALLALGASVTTSTRGLTVDALLDVGLEPDEVLVSVHIPPAPATSALRQLRRTHITWPVAGASVVWTATGTTVALHGAAMRALVAHAADAEEAISDVLNRIDPPGDARASAEYRADVLPVLAARALAAARA